MSGMRHINDFGTVGADLEARETKRLHLEQTIQRLRTTLKTRLQADKDHGQRARTLPTMRTGVATAYQSQTKMQTTATTSALATSTILLFNETCKETRNDRDCSTTEASPHDDHTSNTSTIPSDTIVSSRGTDQSVCEDLELLKQRLKLVKTRMGGLTTTSSQGSPSPEHRSLQQYQERQHQQRRQQQQHNQQQLLPSQQLQHRRLSPPRIASRAFPNTSPNTPQLQVELYEARQLLCHSQKTYAEEIRTLRKAAMEQLDHLEGRLEVKDEQVEFYEFKLRNRERELDTMREELQSKARRVTELEVELETHNLRYLSERNNARILEYVNFEDASDGEVASSRSVSNRITQTYIKKLQADLDEMERKYVREKVDGAVRVATLETQAANYETKVQSLQQHLDAYRRYDEHGQYQTDIHLRDYRNKVLPSTIQAPDPPLDHLSANRALLPRTPQPYAVPHNSSINSTSASASGSISIENENDEHALMQPSTILPSLNYIKQRLELLEMENINYRGRVKELKTALEDQRRTSREYKSTVERDLAVSQRENKALEAQIQAMETDLSFAYGEIDSVEVERRCARLDKQIGESTADILSLEDQLFARDDQIANLRCQLIDRKVAGVNTDMDVDVEMEMAIEASSSADATDTKTASPKPQHDDHASGGTSDETVSSYILEMQGQLRDCRKDLSSKETELSKLRAYYASRVADLQISSATTVNRKLGLALSKQPDDAMFFL